MIFLTRICVDWDASYSSQVFHSLFQSQLWSKVTSGGSAFHNTSWRHTATTPGTGLLLARSVAGPKVGDYSWHGTTPGPQRSWAESRRLLLARDYSWPVTPVLQRFGSDIAHVLHVKAGGCGSSANQCTAHV